MSKWKSTTDRNVRLIELKREYPADESGVKESPDIIRFESGEDAFVFACGTCKSSYYPGDVLLGVVESVDASTASREDVAIYRLKVQSPCGGKIIPNAISAVDVGPMRAGDLIVFQVHSDSSERGAEELAGMVGVIAGRVEPELHLTQGWKKAD